MRLAEYIKTNSPLPLIKLQVFLGIIFLMLGVKSQAQSESCDALEVRLTLLMDKVSKEDSRWVKKQLIPKLCAVPEGIKWIAKVDSMVTVMESNRASASGEIRDYLHSVQALCLSLIHI